MRLAVTVIAVLCAGAITFAVGPVSTPLAILIGLLVGFPTGLALMAWK